MDDSKLFAKSRTGVDAFVKKVNIYCNAIGINFGITICTVLAGKGEII